MFDPMLPDPHIWLFHAEGGRFAGGAFTTREKAEAWIAARRLSGVLTAYPVDEGCFDWAHRVGAVTGRARDRGDDPKFVGSFATAVQDHFHYTNGSLGGGE